MRRLLAFMVVSAACGGDPAPEPDVPTVEVDAQTAATDASAPDADAQGLETDAQSSVPEATVADVDTASAETDVPPLEVDTQVAETVTASGLVVHEWATFTVFHAVQAKQHVAGVQRHEEAIPATVHVRDLGWPQAGAQEVLAEPVLAKVQTAGAWFHGDPVAFKATVELPQGVVTADWPEAAQTLPKPATPTSLQGGKTTWQLHHLGDAPVGGDEPGIFGMLGKVKAGVIKVPGAKLGEFQRFLFWRALAKFSPPVRFAAKKNQFGQFDVTIWNDGEHAIPNAFLLHLHEGGGLLQKIGGIAAKSTFVATPTPKESPVMFLDKAEAAVAEVVQQQGLPADEALPLAQTFTQNWLKTYGLRIVVVAPSAWGQQYFPTTYSPAPAQHVRVALGRFELLTEVDEQALQQQFAAAAKTGDLKIMEAMGFFAEPKVRRVLDLAAPGQKAFGQQLLDAALGLK
jgi:hypothetical protein